MKNTTKLLMIAMIIIVPLLSLKVYGQTFYSVEDTIAKYDSIKNEYLVIVVVEKLGSSEPYMGKEYDIRISSKKNPFFHRYLTFNKMRDSLGNYVLDESFIKDVIYAPEKINDDGSCSVTIYEKYYGKRGQSYIQPKPRTVIKNWS